MRKKIQLTSNKNSKHLAIISAFEFNENYLIPISKNWSKFFGTTNPKFQAKIDTKGNYVLVGPQVQQPTKRNHNSTKVVTDSD